MEKNRFIALVILAGVCLTPIQACSADPKNQPIEKDKNDAKAQCSGSNGSRDALPEGVLVATDIESTDNFIEGKVRAGEFYAEMGGAEIVVSVERKNGFYSVTRTYSEPALMPESEAFNLHCPENSTIYGNEVVARFVEDGVLWLERTSANDFIPPDLWLYLTSKP